MNDDANKSMDDNFFIQKICIIFQVVNLKHHHKIQSISINFRWT